MSSVAALFAFFTNFNEGNAQIKPPGNEREVQKRQAMLNTPILDRDTITIIDTTLIFDPATYQEEVKVITSKYSLRDYCKSILGMNDPDILLDRKPHTIVDPRTYEDITIILNESGKLETLPK